MPFSSGTFSVYTPGNPAVSGTTISSTAFNNTMNDFATGLSTCILKDGSQTVTANIPMSGFKFTGLGAGSSANDSLRYNQLYNAAGITLIGNLLFTDASFDIGASGATRPRDFYLSRNAVIGGTINVTGHTTFEGVTSTGATGTGKLVYDTAPTLGSGTIATTQSPADNSTKLATTAYVDGNKIVTATPQATTSGTTKDFTSIPSWVKRITVITNGVSTNGTSNLLVQIGTGGSPTTSGYDSGAHGYSNTFASSTAGFLMSASFNATNPSSGLLILCNISGNIWVASGSTATSVAASTSAGNVTLAGALDNLRFTTVSGDTFDAGSVTITY